MGCKKGGFKGHAAQHVSTILDQRHAAAVAGRDPTDQGPHVCGGELHVDLTSTTASIAPATVVVL